MRVYEEMTGTDKGKSVRYNSPYSRRNQIARMLWVIVWGALARPFPRSTVMPWKRFLLRLFGAKIAPTANVYATAEVFQPWKLVMEDYSCLAGGVDCYNAADIKVCAGATVSQRAFLCTAGHDITDSSHPQTEAPIIVGPQAWVCAEAYVGQGVTIGEGAVCAARSVVVKDVPPWTVVGGNPAREIKKREMKG